MTSRPTPADWDPVAELHRNTAERATPELVQRAVERFLNHYFKREGDRPKVCIPVEPDDDDLLLVHAAREYAAAPALVARVRELSAALASIGCIHPMAGRKAGTTCISLCFSRANYCGVCAALSEKP